MEILNNELVREVMEYWHLFHEYINVSNIFLWGLLGGIIGVIVVIILEIIFRKKILVRRRYKVLKFIAYLYFAFFPLYSGFCFSQWFALNATEKQIVQNIPTVLGNSNTLFNKYLKDYIEEQVGKGRLNITTNEGVDIGVELAMSLANYLKLEQDTVESGKGGQIMSFVSNLLKSEYIKGEAKNQIVDLVSSNFGIEKEVVKELMDTEIQSILDTGAVNVFVEAKIKSVFNGLKFQVALMYLIGMCIPIAEIVLAHYLERKRRRDELSGSNITVNDEMDDRD